ncbi:MAG: ComEC/Rec2 family competence protein [Rikenellaceae bacterium]|jgi:competence protein ComEC|nr:ComEC/Rec2 family competence protein [Rikenellaceae bacterium]
MLRELPFLRILIPAATGILLADATDIAGGWIFLLFLLALACAATLKRWSGAYLWAAICFLYMALAAWARPSSTLPHGVRAVATARITGNPTEAGRWLRSPARITSWRTDSLWHNTSERVFLYMDSSLKAGVGSDIAFRGYFNPVGEGGYGELMARRGYGAKAYVPRYGLIYSIDNGRRSFSERVALLQKSVGRRLDRLGLAPEENAVAQAMVLGNTTRMSPQLRRDYARAGTTHILSVSGMHVGVVFLFINCLLWLVPLLRRGHIAKNAVAVAAIWSYAALTGMSPSVMRAAFLFTGTQAALALSARSQPLNTLFATGAVMLALSPNALWDVSFQLSFMAVLSIMVWGVPLYRVVRTRWGAVNVVLAGVTVGATVTLFTAPAVAWHFGYFSVVGIVVNIVVELLSYVILAGSLTWVALPAGFLAPLLRWPVESALWLQNRLSHWGAAQSWGVVESSPSGWTVAAIYAAVIGATALFVLRREARLKVMRRER